MRFEVYRKLQTRRVVVGKPIRDTALRLLKNKWVDFLGTDLHHDQQLIGLRKALQDRTVQRMLSAYEFRNGDLGL